MSKAKFLFRVAGLVSSLSAFTRRRQQADTLALVPRPVPRVWSTPLLKNMFCPVSLNHAVRTGRELPLEVLGHGFFR